MKDPSHAPVRNRGLSMAEQIILDRQAAGRLPHGGASAGGAAAAVAASSSSAPPVGSPLRIAQGHRGSSRSPARVPETTLGRPLHHSTPMIRTSRTAGAAPAAAPRAAPAAASAASAAPSKAYVVIPKG